MGKFTADDLKHLKPGDKVTAEFTLRANMSDKTSVLYGNNTRLCVEGPTAHVAIDCIIQIPERPWQAGDLLESTDGVLYRIIYCDKNGLLTEHVKLGVRDWYRYNDFKDYTRSVQKV